MLQHKYISTRLNRIVRQDEKSNLCVSDKITFLFFFFVIHQEQTQICDGSIKHDHLLSYFASPNVTYKTYASNGSFMINNPY